MNALGNDSRYAGSLRSALAAKLVDTGAIRSRPVAAAVRSVPRHLFVPNVSLEIAYTDDVVLMKSDDAGTAISTVSQPTVVAMMLEQAGIAPGHRILEIGSGGYNAALMSELAGPGGAVTSIDIDAEVTSRARQALAGTGYQGVRVFQADGQFGWPEGAPYDLVLLTVTAEDIAPAWLDQLAEGGRLVVPLRLRGQTRSIAFDKVQGVLHGRSSVLCGFVSMQGAGTTDGQVVRLDGDKIVLTFDEDQVIDGGALQGILRQPPRLSWCGILIDREEPFSNLDLWLATRFPGYCVLSAHRSSIKSGLVSPVLQWGGAAVVEGGSLAYLTSRPSPAPHLIELGIIAHGPTAKRLADHLAGEITAWDQTHRHGPGPRFTVHPKTTPATDPPGRPDVTTRHTLVTVHWP
ncbi:protein-L-isoaspartate(D-aspartate) O-methyltransferase [Kribbella amoyensis]|uniref:Protein-L-isoaspartate O-methyltransferase n=1 Tax=Kribbella amoyensis TaxID=996641 RepID=A0A561C1A1_9ACTN|nr:methyltransferase, FxLD system [Kribbella amoyensis]TWD84834.1 protein-L-isoaspartate(D-aspartate) O-methyltransferase [Kribbella amoyensis]